jgi:hypothetical protein
MASCRRNTARQEKEIMPPPTHCTRVSITTGVLALLALASIAKAQAPAIPLEPARAYLAEARTLCTADGGDLWGVTLCGPMMFVDPRSRAIVANQQDPQGQLTPEGTVFVGTMAPEVNVANTAVEWGGLRWTQLLWPLPADAGVRATLLMHESFHRIQPQLRASAPREADNAHLDSLEGRYLMQLEWRALARAISAPRQSQAKAAARDALLFRARRHELFAKAAAGENALELNEGLAEYTGVRVGHATADARLQSALRDLRTHASDPSLVRSFAYATGPAYGLLLDRWAPDWRRRIGPQEGFGPLLGAVLGQAGNQGAKLEAAAARYDGAELRAAETVRDARRQERLREYRQRFISGPVLEIPLVRMSVQFDPRDLQPLDDAGTVYPYLRVSDDWGVLEAKTGALLKPDWSAVIVPGPVTIEGNIARGDGWSLTLNRGWRLKAGARAQDFGLARDP